MGHNVSHLAIPLPHTHTNTLTHTHTCSHTRAHTHTHAESRLHICLTVSNQPADSHVYVPFFQYSALLWWDVCERENGAIQQTERDTGSTDVLVEADGHSQALCSFSEPGLMDCWSPLHSGPGNPTSYESDISPLGVRKGDGGGVCLQES